MSVYVVGKALKECQAHGKEIQTGIKPYFLKVVGGYLTEWDYIACGLSLDLEQRKVAPVLRGP